MEPLVFSAKNQPPPPDKPPDDDGGKVKMSHSFRDMLLGNKPASPPRGKTDLIAEGLVRVEYEEGKQTSS